MQMQSENLNEFALALSKAQGAIKNAKKDCNNPFFKSKYADLTSVSEACKEQLSTNQIAVVQGGDDTETHLVLITTLIHSSGQWMKSKLMIKRTMEDKQQRERSMTAQEIGAAITYLRRFSLTSMVGVCPEDDDGNLASGKIQESQRTMPSAPAIEYIKSVDVTLLENAVGKIPGYRDKLMVYLSKSYGIKEFKYLTSKLFVEIMTDVKKHISAKETQIETKELANA
jgi:hypothetical protein